MLCNEQDFTLDTDQCVIDSDGFIELSDPQKQIRWIRQASESLSYIRIVTEHGVAEPRVNDLGNTIFISPATRRRLFGQ